LAVLNKTLGPVIAHHLGDVPGLYQRMTAAPAGQIQHAVGLHEIKLPDDKLGYKMKGKEAFFKINCIF